MGRRGKAAGMTGGMAIVEALVANGVDVVFGLPGAQLYPLFDALQQKSDAIRTIGARHEQACGYMAFGYARSTGRPGVYAVVIYHDENDNHRFDRAWNGLPAEGFGVSNNPRPFMRPPTLAEAAFEVGSGHRVMKIELRY